MTLPAPVDMPPTLNLPVPLLEALSYAVSIDDVLAAAAEWLPRVVGAEIGRLSFFDGARQIHRAYYGQLSDRYQDQRTDILPGSPHDRVMQTGLPVMLDQTDIAKEPGALFEWLLGRGVSVYMAVPLRYGDDILGIFSVCKRDPTPFSQAEQSYLVNYGRLVAVHAKHMQQLRNVARLAETDALTGVANRTRLMRVLEGPGHLQEPDSKGRVLGVLQIDLDHFKQVNDLLGHAVGDAVLRHAAQVMQAAVGPTDLVARTGGDEFVIVTRTDPGGRAIAALATKLSRTMRHPIQVDGVEARVGISIGIALATDADGGADRLIGNADMALYEVKRNGRGGARTFCDAMRADYERRVQLMSDLRDAVERQCFEPYFQPQVTMETGHFSGFEMLARWPHPTLGLVDPADFIELAAEAGLSEKIDHIVRSKGLNALRKLRDDGWDAPKMSFNASARTLDDPKLVKQLLQEVRALGLRPQDLVLEVREADLISLGSDKAFYHINALSHAGFDVELDDFGAGHAAMTNLGRLAISAVKLDESIIAPLPAPRADTILRAVIAMAKELGLGVVAEGVETAGQFAVLRQLGCDIAQGYGVSKPLPLDGLIRFMQGYGKAPVMLAQDMTG